ncbi:hypothetical protein L6468_12285 [Prevotella communis]|uniref:hypothetical protein n=1 Tax=Prevotella communis TaxID=2913614 RepID=UPI001EDACF3F|nr:hypothetical protein [Prevotella communis]UKK61746.1 hypothetical protein L6468_12285 [Prevotella communis]UKK64572.1 hypothetical protein L6473_12290 [Prevotella communis]
MSELTESLERGKTNFQAQIELYDLRELCYKMDNPQLLEYVPVKIVACFEQLFRDEYQEILVNPKVKKNLKNIDLFKDTKFNFDVIGAFEENTISLSDYLSLLIPCSKLADIDNALSKLLGINFLSEFRKKENGNIVLESINEIFRLRHIYCHEVPLKKNIDIDSARKLISHAIEFIDNSDDIIRNTLYSDQIDSIKEIEIAQEEYEKADKELDDLIETLKLKQDKGRFHYNDFSYIDKWKEYRQERALCDSSIEYKESYSPLDYYRNLERTTRSLLKEIKEDYKYELKR